MVVVEYFNRVRKLFRVFRLFRPGQIQKPLYIQPQHVCFGTRALHFAHARKLFQRLFFHFRGHMLFLYLSFKLFLLVHVVAKLGVNGFQLFAKIIFFLVFIYALTDGGVYLLFKTGNFKLVV